MDALTTKQTEMFIRVGEDRQEFALACPEGSYGAEYGNDPAKLALWESALHVGKPPRRAA